MESATIRKLYWNHHKDILQWSERFRIPVERIYAIIIRESAGEPKAFRYEDSFYQSLIAKKTNEWVYAFNPHCRKGVPSVDTEKRAMATSWGLMQIMGVVARERGFREQFLTQLLVPGTGIEYGCRHLVYLMTRLRRTVVDEDVIYAWNRGPGAVDKTTPLARRQYPYVREVLEISKEVRPIIKI